MGTLTPLGGKDEILFANDTVYIQASHARSLVG